MKRINKYAFLIISFVTSTTWIYSFVTSSISMWEDPDYVDSLNLPSNADSIGIPLAGAVMTGFSLIAFNIILHVVLALKCSYQKKDNTVSLISFLPQEKAKILNKIKYFTYFFTLYVLAESIKNYDFINEKILKLDTISYMTFVLTSVITLIWLTYIFGEKSQPISQKKTRIALLSIVIAGLIYLALGIVHLNEMNKWNLSLEQMKQSIEKQINTIKNADPSIDLANAIKNSDYRFAGTFHGWGDNIPGLDKDEYDKKYKEKYGVKIILSTGDIITFPEELDLREVAREYAEKYNTLLLEEINKNMK